MRDVPWLKTLELVQLKMGAEDARIEIGGRPPTDPSTVWQTIDESRRLVVIFPNPPENKPALEDKLATLVDGFRESLAGPPEAAVTRAVTSFHRELDLALAQLGDRTGAETVWIIDIHSPVIWGGSEPRSDALDLDALLMTARADRALAPSKLSWAELLATPEGAGQERLREAGLSGAALREVYDELVLLRELSDLGGLAAAARRLRAGRALAEIRARAARDHNLIRSELRGPEIQCFAHALAGQYQLVLVFDETFSPLHAEGNVQRALPHIERLLLSLPPVDPLSGGGRGAKVIRLRR